MRDRMAADPRTGLAHLDALVQLIALTAIPLMRHPVDDLRVSIDEAGR
jgi:hypothetical protein